MDALGSLESTQEVRVAIGYASSNFNASLVLSKLPSCIHNSIYARLGMKQFLIVLAYIFNVLVKNKGFN